MNKELKKAVETELNNLLNAALSVRNKKAADSILKNIKASSKNLAKKFVKHLPVIAAAKKVKKAVKVKKVKKAISKPVKAVKKSAGKVKRAIKKK